MYHLHLTRNLRSLLFVVIACAVPGALGTLWWANRTGLPESWRATIEREVAKQGAFIEIGALSYIPFRGVVAKRVRVFADSEHTREISNLESILLDFEKTKLARGQFHLTKIELNDGRLSLPVDPKDPFSETLEVTGANGTLLMPGDRRFEIREAKGRIEGIDVSLDALIIGYQGTGKEPPDDNQTGKRRKLLAKVISEIKKWSFDPERPPSIRLSIEGDANDSSSLVAKFGFRGTQIGQNSHELEEITAEAEVNGDLLTVTSLKASDSHGVLEGRLDYDIGGRDGRFDLVSSLEIQPLLQAWAGLPPMKDMEVSGGQKIEAAGDFHLDEKNHPQIRMTGKVEGNSVSLRGLHFDSVKSAFSWRNGDLFFRDAVLSRADGEAKAKVLVQWPMVRLALESTLPEHLYKPLFIGQPLEKVISDFKDRKGAEIFLSLEGGFDATDRHSWAYTGHGNVKNVDYKGVPIHAAECKFALSHHELDFYEGTVNFNYQNYPLREAFDGPKQGTAKVGRIRYVAATKTVDVENVQGTIWAAPLVRLFAPPVADSLEIYRFHTPPDLTGNGVVDVTKQGRTSLDVSFRSAGMADYKFLGENVTLGQPSGKVEIRGERVVVDNLKLEAFSGPVSGRFDWQGKGRLSGEMSWSKLAIPALCSTYDFNMKGGGETTGRIEFSLTDGKVETMNGEGLMGIDKTELFSVPIFGPLSGLMSGVLNDRNAGFEQAKSAFCNFQIRDGVLSTRDFQTATPSLVFAGDGSVDMRDRTIDMTMRMNAKGLLGIITLPLRPFYGMFQFRGTGPLKETKWENVMFTSPPGEQQNLLKTAPKARVVGGRSPVIR